MYGTEQDQINDETDPLKKRELEKNRKYPTAYYHMIYNTTGMAGVNAIELNYNWVVRLPYYLSFDREENGLADRPKLCNCI